jgi:glucokinase
MDELILALDFGGTKLTAAITTLSAATSTELPTWLGLRRVFSPPGSDAESDRETMIKLGRELLAAARPAAVGVSFGGPVDFPAGTVRLSHHVPCWENVPLGEQLAAAFGAQVAVDNDANVAALGEHRYGAGRGAADMLYITVSTGVGGGWVLGGRPWRGYEGMAGEIGHIAVDWHGPLCLCGKHGCVERLASGPYMAGDAEALLQERPGRGQLLRTLWSGEPGTLNGKALAEAAEAGDDVAQEILLRGARALGAGIGNAANLINPQLVVLGGGVTKSGELWWSAVRQAARETMLPEVHCQIVAAALGDDAPLWGAVALAVEAANF